MIVCLDGHNVLLDHPMCPLLCVGRSLLEQKINKMAAEFTRKQLEREATALEYKRFMHACLLDGHDVLLDHPVCLPPCVLGAV